MNSLSTTCFHCGLPAPRTFDTDINGQNQSFCCPGCRAVCLLIQDSGLDDFYKHRESLPLSKPFFSDVDSTDPHDLSIYDDPEYQCDFVDDRLIDSDKESSKFKTAHLQIYGMNCSACAWLIENQLQKIASIDKAQVNYSQRSLHLQWNNEQAQLSDLLRQVHALGFEFSPNRADQRQSGLEREESLFLRRIGVAGIGMMQVGMYAMAGYFGAGDSTLAILQFASLLVATLVIFYAAKPFFKGAWRAITHKHLSMDVPVSLALGLAYVASLVTAWANAAGDALANSEVYFDAICMFTFFLLASRFFEFKARSRWHNQQLEPRHDDLANLVDEQGNYHQVPCRTLNAGQKILIKTGERFPVDALLQSEHAEISQAQLTGEFLPLSKTIGQEISSGSINLGEPVEAMVLRSSSQSTLSRISQLVARAQLHKPRISGLADQISGYFVAAVLILATATYLFWMQRAPEQAFWVALSVLVVSCPCALSLATPTALTVLMHHLHSKGVLVQNPAALETLDQIDQVIFDKTGTLTSGEFHIKGVQDLSGDGDNTQIERAAQLEKLSSHPIANAFTKKSSSDLHTDGHFEQGHSCSDWTSFQGRGIEARIDGELMRIGDRDFVAEIFQGRTDSEFKDAMSAPATNHQKQVYLGSERGPLAIFALSDLIRPEAALLVNTLTKGEKKRTLSIFSGDRSEHAVHTGLALGITDVRRGMTAEQKMAAMAEIQNSGGSVLALGDGVNDAPLLAAAKMSIAVGNAVDLSKQKADFILLSNNLMVIDDLLLSAKKGKAVIAQNLLWALTYNICAIPLAMAGLVPPWLAALGMSASSAVVVLNAFRARSVSERTTANTATVESANLKTALS